MTEGKLIPVSNHTTPPPSSPRRGRCPPARPLSVVPLGPVVAGATLPEDEVVGTEDLTVGATSHRVHGAWFEVDEDCLNFPSIIQINDKIPVRLTYPWNIFPSRGLVVVDLDPLQLQVGGLARERSGGIDAVLIAEQDK